MRIPGTKRSSSPDECGFRSGQFAEAVRSNVMAVAWDLLSKETKGVRQGVWATQKGIDLQVVYQVAHDPQHPMFQTMMEDFREAVLKMWPLEDLTDLGIAPTSYVDDHHAFAFLPFGVTGDHEPVFTGTLMPGLVIPMVLEESQWMVDLPSWRFAWSE